MLFAFGMSATTFGQVSSLTRSLTATGTIDSATNADTAVLYCTVKNTGTFAIQALFGRISGTINAKAYIEYSLNGTSWNMYSAADTFNVQPTSTSPKNKIFYSPTSTLPGYPVLYARIVVVNRSTSVLRLTAILTKK